MNRAMIYTPVFIIFENQKRSQYIEIVKTAEKCPGETGPGDDNGLYERQKNWHTVLNKKSSNFKKLAPDVFCQIWKTTGGGGPTPPQ